MIALYLTVCLGWNLPTGEFRGCHDVELPHQFPDIQACSIASQPAAAEFMGEHPQYFLSAVRCAPPQKET